MCLSGEHPGPAEPHGDGSSSRSRVGLDYRTRNLPADAHHDVSVPFAGTVISVAVEVGRPCRLGQTLLVLESMKMEHVVEAAAPGTVESVAVSVGDAVQAGDELLRVDEVVGDATGP